MWKNLVFLSPWISQLYLDLTDQNSSSCWRISKWSFLNCASRLRRWSLGQKARLVCTPFNLASTLFFLWKRLPKTSLFQILTSAVNLLWRQYLFLKSLAKCMTILFWSPNHKGHLQFWICKGLEYEKCFDHWKIDIIEPKYSHGSQTIYFENVKLQKVCPCK